MKTAQNDKIRVTVTDEIWSSYAAKAEWTAKLSTQTPEQATRGMILSAAMEKIANAQEAARLGCRKPTMDQVMERARRILVWEYLAENCRYDLQETVFRMENGHRMSEGMAMDVAQARAYADGLLAPLTNDELMRRAGKIFSAEFPRRADVKTLALRANTARATAADVIERAAEELSSEIAEETAYRARRAKNDGWDIEILDADAMPRMVGVCEIEI